MKICNHLRRKVYILKLIRPTLVFVFISLVALGNAQQVTPPPVENLMDSNDFTATGLYKLTDEELAALNRWLVLYANSVINVYGGGNTVSPSTSAPSQGSVIESRIDGTFEGWDGETIFKLMNGQIWQQAEYSYMYHYAYSPDVTIYESGGSYVMEVEGVGDTIRVKRIK